MTRVYPLHPLHSGLSTSDANLCHHVVPVNFVTTQRLDVGARGRYAFAGYEIRLREGLRLSLHLYRGGRHY